MARGVELMRFWNRLSYRIVLGYVLFMLFLLVGGAMGIGGVYSKDAVYSSFLNKAFPIDRAVGGLKAALAETAFHLEGYLIDWDVSRGQRLETSYAAARDFMAKLQAEVDWPEGKTLVAEMAKSLDELGRIKEQAVSQKKTAADIAFREELERAVNNAGSRAEDLARAIRQQQDLLLDQARATTRTFEYLTVISLALIFAGGVVASFAVVRSIQRPLELIMRESEEMGEGDLTVQNLPTARRDEFGILARSFEKMMQNMEGLIKGIRQLSLRLARMGEDVGAALSQEAEAARETGRGIEEVATGAKAQSRDLEHMAAAVRQLGDAISQIAAGAQEQARSVNESSSFLTQMARTIEEVASRARNSAEASARATQAARSGRQAVARTVEGNQRVRESVFEAASRIKELGDHSQKIGEIIQVITDIADQTNLLALNAAIEAARAGEHGRGFAVVAEEVRKLAERSARATREIGEIIGTIQGVTERAIRAMEKGKEEAEVGSRLVEEAGQVLDSIQATVEGAMTLVQEISAAAQSLLADAEKAVRAMDAVASVTEENSAAAEEMAASSNEVLERVNAIAGIAERHAQLAERLTALAAAGETHRETVHRQMGELMAMVKELDEKTAVFRLTE